MAQLKALIVDDDVVARRLVTAALRAQFTIVEAADGLAAVECFRTEAPDLVVMDVEMPRMSGPDAVAAIRELAGLRYVPILLVSSLDDRAVLTSALARGADDFLPKPFNRVLFESKLQVFSRIRDMQSQLVDQNRKLQRFRDETEAEQLLAKVVFDRLLQRGALRDPRVVVKASPLAVLSGDLVAAAQLDDGRFRWLLGDVAGHGLSGAIGTLPVATLFEQGCRIGQPLVEFTQVVNAELKTLLPASLFCAAAVLELDGARETLSVINAGLPAIVVRTEAGFHQVPSTTLPLGITSRDFCPTVIRLPVTSGDVVWAMSDGVTEASSPSGELFGLARVQRALSNSHPDAAVTALQTALRSFTNDVRADDEMLIGVSV